MARPDPRRKVDVSRPAAPLQFNPFAALGEVEALKNLAPGPEVEKKANERAQKVELILRQAKDDGNKTKPRDDGKKEKAWIAPNSRGRLILRREKKDRGGKVVVVIFGFDVLPGANAVMIGDLAKELKGKLGCGGSFDRREIVLQGDRCAEVCAALEGMGFRVDGVRA